MIIGIPKEIKEQEQRVALLPSAANQFVRRGHSVVVEKNAGIGSGYADEAYVKAGAEIVAEAKEVFARADMIVKVKEPREAELPLLRKGQILFTYLHLAASKSLTEALLKSGVTAVAYETIQTNNRFIGDRCHAGFQQCLGERFARGQMQIGEKNLALAQQRKLCLPRLLHFHNHVGTRKNLLRFSDNLSAGLYVGFIRIT